MKANNPDPQKGIFLNGRAQVIDLLQKMEGADRETLLDNIRKRNVSLFQELKKESLGFFDLLKLPELELKSALARQNPAVLGIALKRVPEDLQKRALKSITKESAQRAFEAMVTPLPNEDRDIKRAQNRVIELIRLGF